MWTVLPGSDLFMAPARGSHTSIIRDSFSIWAKNRKLGFRFLADVDPAHHSLWLMTYEIDLEKAIRQVRTADLDAVGQDKCALELPRCNTAIKVLAVAIIGLLAAHHKLVVFKDYIELIARKSGHSQRDPKPLGAVCAAWDAFDVVGGIAIAAFGGAIDKAFDLIEPQQQWI